MTYRLKGRDRQHVLLLDREIFYHISMYWQIKYVNLIPQHMIYRLTSSDLLTHAEHSAILMTGTELRAGAQAVCDVFTLFAHMPMVFNLGKNSAMLSNDRMNECIMAMLHGYKA